MSDQKPIIRSHLAGKAARRREARSNQASAVCLSYISRMTIVKTSASYFSCAIPATTAAILSSI
jgi:hypothetical protein